MAALDLIDGLCCSFRQCRPLRREDPVGLYLLLGVERPPRRYAGVEQESNIDIIFFLSHALLKHTKSVRDSFSKYDTHSYGYIATADFRRILDDPAVRPYKSNSADARAA